MTAPRHTGSVRPRALAAFSPAPRRPDHSPGHRPPDSPGNPRPPTRAEPLEPRTLLATFVVTTEADDGPGSLRQAILSANAAPGADTVSFALPGAPGTVHTIRPAFPLPAISDPLTVDATTQPGYSTSPLVELDGTLAGADVDGLSVRSEQVTLRALAINRFSRHGVAFLPGPRLATDWSAIDGCYVGIDPSGTAPRGNGDAGVLITTGLVRVFATSPNARSVISANGGAGIWIRGMSARNEDVSISHTHIGVNAAGTAALGNRGDGIFIQAGNAIIVGSASDAASAPSLRNVISGNGGCGVRMLGNPYSPKPVQIADNYIGTDATGTLAIPNGSDPSGTDRDGISLTQTIARVRRNVISGNAGSGVIYHSATGLASTALDVTSNFIGTTATGAAPLGNGADGIVINGSGQFGVEANTISANRGRGIVITESGTFPRPVAISGNFIGTNADGAPLGNGGNGIEQHFAGRVVTIGGPNPIAGPGPVAPAPPGTTQNVIAANGGHGIYVVSIPTATGYNAPIIRGNSIGTDATDRLDLGNAGSGVYLDHVRRATIGPAEEFDGAPPSSGRFGNVIAHNGEDGVTVVGASGDGATGNRIRANHIHSNRGLGIDLGDDGVTLNDPRDVDQGANSLLNYPIVTSVVRGRTTAAITVTIDASSGRPFHIDLFTGDAADPTGFGEGERFLQSIPVRGASVAPTGGVAVVPVALLGRWLTATVTDDLTRATSEFSPAVSAASGRPIFRPPTRPGPDVAPTATMILDAERPFRGVPPSRELLT